MKIQKRSLYQCEYAKVEDSRIACDKGIELAPWGDGSIDIKRLARGTPLELTACQTCEDYLELGPPVSKADRGWIK